MLGGRQDTVVRDVSFAGLDELEPLDQVALVGLHFSEVGKSTVHDFPCGC